MNALRIPKLSAIAVSRDTRMKIISMREIWDKSVLLGGVDGQVKAEGRSVRLTWGNRVRARDLEIAGCTEARGLTHFDATLWEYFLSVSES
jgi:hypothetical protein